MSLSKLTSLVYEAGSNLNMVVVFVCLATWYWYNTESFTILESLPGGALVLSTLPCESI